MDYRIDLRVVWNNLPEFFPAIMMTLFLGTGAMFFGLIVGLVIALMRMSKYRALSAPASAYINFFRGAPQYVLIFWVYYGLAVLFGLNFAPITAGLISLSAQYGAYLAEVYRSGIEAIGRGQREAALSMGLGTWQSYRYIILPQAIRIVLPPIGNNWIGAIKDSSLISVIGVMEVMRVSYINSNDYFRPFEFYILAALIYIVLAFTLSRINNAVEAKLRIA